MSNSINYDPNSINRYENTTLREGITAAKSGGKSGGSWMYALALTLGNMADKMGKQIAKTAGEIDTQTDAKYIQSQKSEGGQSSSFGISALNARMQVETQLLSMFMGGVSNLLKTLGEGNKALGSRNG